MSDSYPDGFFAYLLKEHPVPRKPILSLDFDGVIHSYTSGWKKPHVILDPPVDGAFSFIEQALDHFEVNIFSSRSHEPGAIEAIQDWFISNAMPSHILAQLVFPKVKPPATISIDDRGFLFSGVFPSVEELLDFRPWNKGSPAEAEEVQRKFFSGAKPHGEE